MSDNLNEVSSNKIKISNLNKKKVRKSEDDDNSTNSPVKKAIKVLILSFVFIFFF